MNAAAPAVERSRLEARGLEMRFPGVRALAGVDFDVAAGEVHALVGENGAGKSTLVRILAGEESGYVGSVRLDSIEQRYGSPHDALRAGVAMIPQELQLVRSLTVAENIFLGHEPAGPAGWVDRAAQRRRARAQLDAIGCGRIDVDAELRVLTAAERQLVAIARALTLDAGFLILDEPTAALGAAEGSQLEALARRLAAAGSGVVWISHKLDEVLRLAHRITILRDGERVATVAPGQVDAQGLIRLMVGRDIEAAAPTPVVSDAVKLLEVEALTLPDPAYADGFRFRDVTLSVRAGEIVGLAGLVGARRSEFLRALVGECASALDGRICLGGVDYRPTDPAHARDRGLVLVPEERKADGILAQRAVGENLTISALGRVSRLGWIDRAGEQVEIERMMGAADVRAASTTVALGTLSGGNQQKALLARCLFASPRVLLLDEPTRGIDLAAKAEIYAALRSLAGAGYGVLLCSSEMSEILTQCHRVVVFREGRVAATFDGAEATEEKVLAAAAGSAREASSDGRPAGGGDGGPPGPRGPSGPPVQSTHWWRRLGRHAGLFGLALVLALAILFSPVRGGYPVFLDLGNLTDILRQVAEKGILAVGMTAVVISGGIDLSVGSVLAFGATLSALLLMNGGLGLPLTAAIVLTACAAWGWLNGIIVARWRLPAFIVTLATMSAARGAARFLSGGAAIPLGFGGGGAPESVRALASPLLPYLPAPALVFGATVVAMHLLLSRTTSGRYLYAIGDNESAARLSGVRVAWNTASVYVISATLAGLAGLVHCAQLEQGNPNDGVAYELDAIAAVVVGGTALSGGTGTVGGTLVGVLLIGIINNSLGLNNVDANLQLILKGAIILVAVWLQRRRTQ